MTYILLGLSFAYSSLRPQHLHLFLYVSGAFFGRCFFMRSDTKVPIGSIFQSHIIPDNHPPTVWNIMVSRVVALWAFQVITDIILVLHIVQLILPYLSKLPCMNTGQPKRICAGSHCLMPLGGELKIDSKVSPCNT